MEAVAKLQKLRSLLDDALAALTPEEAAKHRGHLTRLREALDAYALSADDTPRATYLDLLPDEALANIIRHVSERPRSLEYASFIKAKDAQALYCGPGPLSKQFCKMFPSVNVTSDGLHPPPKPLSPSSTLPVPTFFAMPLLSRTWVSGAVAVLDAAGGSITSLRYRGDRASEPAPHLVNWIAPFQKRCAAVKELDIGALSHPFLETVLKHSSDTLESLTLDGFCSGPASLDVVARNCPRLRKLSLSQVKSTPTSLWKAVGPTLEELYVTLMKSPPTPPHGPMHGPPPPSPMQDVVKGIEDHCRVLRRISVPGHTSPAHSQLARLLRSYGEQLEFAAMNFASFPTELCRNVALVCTNAVFEFPSTKRVATVQDLRYQIRKLTVDDENSITPADADLISTNCDDLTAIALRNLEWQAPVILAGMLHQPKPNLTDVTLGLEQDNATQVLQELAEHTTTIRRFEFSVRTLYTAGFREFFVANPLLEKVELNITGKAKAYSMESITEIVRLSASLLPKLKELVVTGMHVPYSTGVSLSASEMTRIADTCVPLRKGKTHVHVFGVDYL